jgi:hypothetical protein
MLTFVGKNQNVLCTILLICSSMFFAGVSLHRPLAAPARNVSNKAPVPYKVTLVKRVYYQNGTTKFNGRKIWAVRVKTKFLRENILSGGTHTC